MPKCETCGNEYDKAFIVEMNNERHTFDSFECAIQCLAPTCSHCECRIIGHGVEAHGGCIAVRIVQRARAKLHSAIGAEGIRA